MNAPILMQARQVSRLFVKRPDYAERLAGWLGATVNSHTVHAVDRVDLTIHQGEVVGLVGESGCGKSTLGRVLAGILPATSGSIQTPAGELRSLTGRAAHTQRMATQMIFQDPMSSLNPRKRVRDIIGEAPLANRIIARGDYDNYVIDVMRRVGLDPDYRNRFPHQFSGGQRQRIGIGRALAVKPEFLICDESIAALDVSIQAQILNLFMDLRQDLGLTYLFISHDLGVVQRISDRTVIMYLGRIVESGPTAEVFTTPRHPYTQALLEEVPRLSNRKRRFHAITGEIPSPLNPPAGCHFHPRCPRAIAQCKTQAPALQAVASGHQAACHLLDGQA
ncbi:ABC transporter ATP-binding protein [Achromobacter seleniivolatilans]|uniref:ABC transporter ATP-binding protein n=1 Tax=Achromobacter seleniivolatilans TaxID=3047478 RepID=A0ABY9M841_9BURK|nr:ABC transporter ATP-binding protein [Achromobacter sp. R39]WMD22842.1 ABC transporter ATP-binding protein [Achromobacter sp. R39]